MPSSASSLLLISATTVIKSLVALVAIVVSLSIVAVLEGMSTLSPSPRSAPSAPLSPARAPPAVSDRWLNAHTMCAHHLGSAQAAAFQASATSMSLAAQVVLSRASTVA